ncbi:MAG: DUF2312 domain-containing protein [Alphaproteobacteria bacterium]|jgi:uncharacterized protein (UPF0335 family)|nr:DUF2312 domain-containing protein [Alphaproteobacteria bacterium]
MADDAGFGGVSAAPQALTQSAKEKLKQIVTRIEKLEEEKKGIAADIKDVYAEAKAVGYDTKALRKVVSLRKIDRQEREEQEMVLDLYLAALGEI